MCSVVSQEKKKGFIQREKPEKSINMQKENKAPSETHQYVGPYRLEKTLGKGQTGK